MTTRARMALLAVLLPLVLVPTAPLVTGPAWSDTDPVGVWPLRPEPAVVRDFDPPASPYGAGHRGVDLLGEPGQPVHAALAGTVTYAGMIAGRGVVVVSHGATRTTYEPVTAAVTVGRPVGAGAVLGSVELGGSHCFPRACLHWGWIAGETYLDPLRLVGLGPVRLLPLWRDEPAATKRLPSPVSPLGLSLDPPIRRVASVTSRVCWQGVGAKAYWLSVKRRQRSQRPEWCRAAAGNRWIQAQLKLGGAPGGTPFAAGPW